MVKLTTRSYRTYQALILGILGLFLLSKTWDGTLLFYINQRFVILILFAALGLVILSQAALRGRPALPGSKSNSPFLSPSLSSHIQEEHAPSGLNLVWLMVPVLLGLLVPARPLGASALANRGINTNTPLLARSVDSTISLEILPNQRTVLDWIRVFSSSPDIQVFTGQPVDVTGFVYHDPRLEPKQFMVSRFAITCCVADAMALGLVVDWPDAAALPGNSWVRVLGRVQAARIGEKNLPIIAADTVHTIPQPEQPYLFP